MVCPGFVQVSQSIPIGVILNPLSSYDGQQYEIRLTIIQVNEAFAKSLREIAQGILVYISGTRNICRLS